jgi:predicted DCC family thiol-disulfide oxidoreductase YuxK
MKRGPHVHTQAMPILLFNDECAVCRRIARWVRMSAESASGAPPVIVQAIGDDPRALRSMNPRLNIWDAYETIHILMPNGSMKLGGEAVAEVLRSLPNCTWFAWVFALRIFGLRPFQLALNWGYALLSEVRPLLGCESCGIPSPRVQFIASMIDNVSGKSKENGRPKPIPHFTARPASPPSLHRAMQASGSASATEE